MTKNFRISLIKELNTFGKDNNDVVEKAINSNLLDKEIKEICINPTFYDIDPEDEQDSEVYKLISKKARQKGLV